MARDPKDILRFEYYADGGGGGWSSIGTSSEVYLEDVSVTTKLAKQVHSYGLTPMITPLGPESREAKLVGSFKGNYLDGPTVSSGYTTNANVLNPSATGIMGGFGIRVLSVCRDLLPELGSGLWRIDQFDINRDAKRKGQFTFSITCGYVWENPAESQIWTESIANEKFQNVQFYDNNGQVLRDVKIYASVFRINSASFSLVNGTYEKDDSIEIFCTSNGASCFKGVIKQIKTKSLGVVTYEAQEHGVALYEVSCMNPETGLFKPRQMIRNPTDTKYLTIKEMADTILKNNYSGHPTIDFTPTKVTIRSDLYKDSEDLPGRKGVKIPPQLISGMSVGKALDTFLNSQCGMYIWFGDNSIEAGYVRDAISLSDNGKYPPSIYFIESTEMIDDNDESFTPNYVVVFSSTGEQAAAYPANGITTSSTCACYKLNTDLLDRGLDAYAKKIYDDLNISDKSKFRVRFPAGVTEFKEADYFTQIGDYTCDPQMLPRKYPADADPLNNPGDSVWQIKEVTITEEYTEVIVGPSYRSIFDIYGNNLQVCDEAPSPKETMTWKSAGMIAGNYPSTTSKIVIIK